MERYDSYKDSGVEWIGKIPSHWNKKRFSYSFSVQKGKIPKILSDENNSDSFPYLSMGVLRGEEPKEFSNENDLVVVKEGDIGLLWDGSNSGEIVKINQTGILSSTVSHLSIKDKNLNNEFSYYLLKFYENDFKNNTVGMGIPHVDGDHVKESKVLIPPLSEQQQIVSFLDTKISHIDSLTDKTQRKIELLKEKRTSLINEVVSKGLNPNVEMKNSGVEWIGEIPSHWEMKKVSYLSKEMISGPFGSSLKKEFYTKSGYKIYGQEQVIKDDFSYGNYYISEEKFNELKRCEIKSGDILISCVGTFGKISMVPNEFEKGIINPRLLKVSPNDSILSKYFLKLLRSEISFIQFESLSRGGTMGVINLDILRQLKFPLPTISEQQQIISYLDEQTQLIDKTISIEEKRIELLKEYRRSLISEVVTGKLKVVE